ncbi:hypothetical protein BGX38DRAFT_1265018 [Terfezia claveryi]|nr:hypothetical protein BGX38DRAFT_1265018 [Terfezia claveryi]
MNPVRTRNGKDAREVRKKKAEQKPAQERDSKREELNLMPTAHSQAVVLHAAQPKYKPGMTWRLIEKDNKVSISWGLKAVEREATRKGGILLCQYSKSVGKVKHLHLNRWLLNTTRYDRDRDKRDKSTT